MEAGGRKEELNRQSKKHKELLSVYALHNMIWQRERKENEKKKITNR